MKSMPRGKGNAATQSHYHKSCCSYPLHTDERSKCKRKSVDYHAKRLLARLRPKYKNSDTKISIYQVVMTAKPLSYQLMIVIEVLSNQSFSFAASSSISTTQKFFHSISQESIQSGWKLDRALQQLIEEGWVIPSVSNKEFKIQVALGTMCERTFKYNRFKESNEETCGH